MVDDITNAATLLTEAGIDVLASGNTPEPFIRFRGEIEAGMLGLGHAIRLQLAVRELRRVWRVSGIITPQTPYEYWEVVLHSSIFTPSTHNATES